jgi:hypothetical protein
MVSLGQRCARIVVSLCRVVCVVCVPCVCRVRVRVVCVSCACACRVRVVRRLTACADILRVFLFGGGVWSVDDGWHTKLNELCIYDTRTTPAPRPRVNSTWRTTY